MLGTIKTIETELAHIELMDDLWEAAQESGYSWTDYKQMYLNYFEEREREQANDYTE